MRRNVQVLSIVYREIGSRREFLLLHRIPEKGAFWQPPSGGVEDDESLLDTLYREVEEETGITKESILQVTPEVHDFSFSNHYITGEPTETLYEHVFGVHVSPNANVTLENNVYVEHDEYKWVSYEEALRLLKWDNNKDGLRKLQEYLQR